MTIPSRPAPAPPQQQQTSHQQANTNTPLKLPPPPPPGAGQRSFSTKINSRNEVSSVTRHFPTARYAPATNWDGSPFDQPTSIKPTVIKKIPPPRPPPPRISPNTSGNTVLKKPGPPQSINVLSNLFGRRKGQTKDKKIQQPLPTTNYISTKLTSLPNAPQNNHYANRFTSQSSTTFITTTSHITTINESGDAELIKFDSPSSSPTFTQQSNSDCVSVDSFSSDSNFSSPQNGSVSQPESGFEDDFLSPSDPWDAFSSVSNNSNNNIPPASRNYGFLNDIRVTQPVRNLNAINRSQNDNPLCNGKSLIPPQGSLSMPTIIKPKTSLYASSSSSSPVHTTNSSIKTPMHATASPQTFNAPFTNFPEAFESFDDGESSPPMPSCPPPPPPTSAILGVISGRLDALDLFTDDSANTSLSYGIALYDFEGTEDGDLSFKGSEKVYLLQRMNDEWYLGRNKRGCEGIFPSNYIEIKVPLKENVQSEKPQTTSSISSASALSSQVKVRVLYNFNAEVPEDLTLKENDMVTALYRINDDWLFGELNSRQGQFPANFLEYIPKNLPNKMP